MKKEEKKIPRSISIIMDGNRRWAREHNLPTLEGHRMGYKKLKEVTDWVDEAGIKFLTVYAFSTENWNRTKKEVVYLMDLFRWVLREEIEEFKNKNIRISVVGEKELLPDDIQKEVLRVEKETKNLTGLHVVLAISYGGRSEIVSAVNKIIKDKKNDVSENDFAKYLWTKDIPDPDLIIRSGGEKRLSNFLPWQSAYSELFFIDTHWPAFTKEEFYSILQEYTLRVKHYGK